MPLWVAGAKRRAANPPGPLPSVLPRCWRTAAAGIASGEKARERLGAPASGRHRPAQRGESAHRCTPSGDASPGTPLFRPAQPAAGGRNRVSPDRVERVDRLDLHQPETARPAGGIPISVKTPRVKRALGIELGRAHLRSYLGLASAPTKLDSMDLLCGGPRRMRSWTIFGGQLATPTPGSDHGRTSQGGARKFAIA